MKDDILLDVRHLTHMFPLTRKLAVKAVDDVSFQLRRGEIFGLVGESGATGRHSAPTGGCCKPRASSFFRTPIPASTRK